MFLCAVLFLWESVVRRDHEVDLCRMQTVCAATTLKTGTQSEPATSSAAETQIIDQLELTNLQDMVDAMLGDKNFLCHRYFSQASFRRGRAFGRERAGISAQSLFFGH